MLRRPFSRLPLALLATSFITLALLPTSTAARVVYAPPGHAGLQEFWETIPDGQGAYNTNDIANVRGTTETAGTIGRRERRKLERLGVQGAAAASLAQADAIPIERPNHRPTRLAGRGRSPLAAVADRLARGSGPGGMGAALPILLLLGLVAALTVVVLRRLPVR
jgi:hypothetical protein